MRILTWNIQHGGGPRIDREIRDVRDSHREREEGITDHSLMVMDLKAGER